MSSATEWQTRCLCQFGCVTASWGKKRFLLKSHKSIQSQLEEREEE